MGFPLAHDEEGLPLDVPNGAAGWLVRRHAGGRGRPAAVYDREGQPLVVMLDSTASDLREMGCKPGMYRLDAVDSARRPMGVAAYTELTGDEATSAEADGTRSGADAAVLALARAVEAMQRVQAERERMQAEMFAKLVERLAPAPVQPAIELRNAVAQALDLQKTLREAFDKESAKAGDGGGEGGPLAGIINAVLPQLVPVAMAWASGKGAGGAPIRNQASVVGQVDAEEEDEGDEEEEIEEGGEGRAVGEREAEDRLVEVLSKLTAEEQNKLQAVIGKMPPGAFEEAQRRMLTVPVEAAVAYVRGVLATMPAPAETPKNGANGAQS